MENSLPTIWHTIAPALADHLWQSTLIAALAALLTLTLRRQHARARYWLWLAASLKFLVPLAFLVAIGHRIAWLRPASAASPAVFVAQEISQPFTRSVAVATPQLPSVVGASHASFLSFAVALWLFGLAAVLLVWIVRWRRISHAIQSSRPMPQGRELEILRRLERTAGLRTPIEILLSSTMLEPGIFGIRRPVLIWPEGISRHLEDTHLAAILAHEVWHVRRRDNLFAALHMFVEAVFWFHPLVWWLGARLLDERERACDEEVVEFGSDRQVYAESILKVCEFCLGSPLPCVSGVTGADLKKRMVHIMTDRILHNLGFARKLLLSTAAFLAIALPVTFGLLNATPTRAQGQADSATTIAPTFDSVTIKPNQNTSAINMTKMMFNLRDGSYVATGVTLHDLIEMAYQVQDSQVSGGPEWLNTAKFDIEAKMNPQSVEEFRKQGPGPFKFDDQTALKSLLSQHFNLALHPENRNLPVYELLVAASGAKLQESRSETMQQEQRMFSIGPGQFTTTGSPISALAKELSHVLGQPVVDKTGLKSNYNFQLRWTPGPNENQFFNVKAHDDPESRVSDPNGPALFDALQQQLGLKLVSHTGPVQVLVVDHAETPAE